MKKILLGMVVGVAGGAWALQMGLTPTGIRVVSDRPACTFGIQWPRMTGEGERSPKVAELSDTRATLVYPGGAKWTLTLAKDGSLTLVPANARVAKDKGIAHNVDLPMSLKEGCSYAMADGARKPFPSAKGATPFLFQGDNKTFTVRDAAGAGFTFAIPYGWAQLQDNRHWGNTQSFAYKTFSDLPGGADYRYVFSVKPLDGKPVEILPAPNLDPFAYEPYPPAAKEALWPGKGPIATSDRQAAVRKGHVARRVQDANAVFFLGDSLTESWRTLEQDLAPIKVANRGLGGDTSRGCLFRLTREVLAHQPAAVVIAAGAGDLAAQGDPADTLANLREMVRLCRAYSDKMPIFLCTVPAPTGATFKPGVRDALNAGIKTFCAEQHCTCVDLAARFKGGKVSAAWTALMKEHLLPLTLNGKKDKPLEKVDLTGYKIVWRDEFDGDKVDATKWHAPTQQRQGASLWDPAYVSVKDGKAVFKIEKTDDPTWRYKSACLRTTRTYSPKDRLYTFTYGYVEARVKVHHWLRSDYWFAVWMMDGSVSDANPDTRKGCEIDIMETFHMNNLGQLPHTFHWNGYGKKHNSQGFTTGPNLDLMNGEFHTYGFLWTPEYAAFTIDGYVTWKTDMKGLGSDQDGKTKSLGVPQTPAYIKLSMEAAPWAGPWWKWEKDMPERDFCEVDWVRVWQK